jgi:curved DNA-binding protein CbpA
VPKDADMATIKKAYRRKSKQCHPDKKGGNTIAMVWVNKAYETLSNPEKREYYDACGADKPLTSLEQLARSILFECALHAVMNAPDGVGLISAISQTINAKNDAALREKNKQETTLQKIRRRAESLSCEEGDNELGALFNQHTQPIKDNIQKLEDQLKAIEVAVKKLKLYKSTITDNSQGGLGFFRSTSATSMW